MNVGPDHWLSDAIRDPIPGGAHMGTRRCLVIHFTSGATAASSVSFWRSPQAKGACAHLVIDRDGAVIQCRGFDTTAGHAGVSRWRDPKTGKRYEGLNSCSIGIELANAGDNEALAKRWSKLDLPVMLAKHRNGGPVKAWERFPSDQMAKLCLVARLLTARYRLDDITGHDCIAPERKNDPGPAFDMAFVREYCGFTGLPEVHA